MLLDQGGRIIRPPSPPETQRAAATFGEARANGPWSSAALLVIAGAGTGKTTTLAHRVAHL